LRHTKGLVDDEDYTPYEFRLPEEDRDGYSGWQLWALMSELGDYIGGGFNELPFEILYF
jgi:hypothetical protein